MEGYSAEIGRLEDVPPAPRAPHAPRAPVRAADLQPAPALLITGPPNYTPDLKGFVELRVLVDGEKIRVRLMLVDLVFYSVGCRHR